MTDAAGITLFLVRHAAHNLLGRAIVGRTPGVSLNANGKRQAERLAQRLEGEAITAVHSSPLERARETAEPIARRLGLPVEIAPALDEIDVGDWTGLSLETLRRRPDWQRWNGFRSGSRAPGGETMLEVQARVVGHIERLQSRQPGGRCALISHGDVIKAALFCFLGVALDFHQRIEVSPASISAVEIGDPGPRVLFINETLPERTERR